VTQRPPFPRFIDITPDLAVCPGPGMVVKRVGDDQCAVFTPGQSAADGGFRVERAWEEVVDELNEELDRAAEEAAGGNEADGDAEEE